MQKKILRASGLRREASPLGRQQVFPYRELRIKGEKEKPPGQRRLFFLMRGR